MKAVTASLAAAAIALPALAGAPHKPEPRERVEYADLSCQAETLNVYFPASESRLTPAAAESLDVFAARLRGCDITGIDMQIGAGDAARLDDGAALARARRAAVFDALAEAGLPLRPAMRGSESEITFAASPEGRALPRSRRTVIDFSLRPAAIG
ncbi:MAG: hypothetical protein GVY06_06040 [Alphaproteobacteria bacterium]|jgi:outer membrane protein OmpA-like peptidoglycan-associated protein|nr:hypothetical protein [Alphaproteobacteria bacterium]